MLGNVEYKSGLLYAKTVGKPFHFLFLRKYIIQPDKPPRGTSIKHCVSLWGNFWKGEIYERGKFGKYDYDYFKTPCDVQEKL